jgi:hypothetical protein
MCTVDLGPSSWNELSAVRNYDLPDEDCEFGLGVARRIVGGTTEEAFELFETLRQARMLSLAVHEINLLLEKPEHRNVARQALRCLGLENVG